VRTAREHLVPSEHEADTWFSRGDWANAAWAYETLAELFPDRNELRRRAEDARARCDQ